MSDSNLQQTERNRIRRLPERADYQRQPAYAILDEGLIAHVGIVQQGSPIVIPMAYARDGDDLLLHGSIASRLMKSLGQGIECCVTVTLLDGLVLARSVFHHSMNYRSVVAFGTATEITDPKDKARAFDQLVEHLVPGRSEHAREASRQETAATSILSMPLQEASIKLRSGPPGDHRDDLNLPVWGGVIPLSLQAGEPLPDEHTPADMPVPEHVAGYRRG